jgi:hypothetical protein
MLTELKRIQVAPDSELARLLDQMGQTPVLLEKGGKLYRLTEELQEDIWTDYDPQKTRAALRKSAGALRTVDRDELLADIHLGRAQDSAGRPADD